MRRNISRSTQKQRWPSVRFATSDAACAGTLHVDSAAAAFIWLSSPAQRLSCFQHLCTHVMSVKVMEKERCLMSPPASSPAERFPAPLRSCNECEGDGKGALFDEAPASSPAERFPTPLHSCNECEGDGKGALFDEAPTSSPAERFPTPLHSCNECEGDGKGALLDEAPAVQEMVFEKKVVRWAGDESAAGLCGHVGNFVRSCPYVHKTEQARAEPWQLPDALPPELSWVVRGKSIGLVPSTLHRCIQGWIRSCAAAPRFIPKTLWHT